MKAIQTNGIGKKCTAHLNLTVSLADWARGKSAKNPPKPKSCPRYERSTNKIPYAGKEENE